MAWVPAEGTTPGEHRPRLRPAAHAGLLFPSQPARPVQSVDRLPRGLGGDANPRSLCYWRPIAFESAKTDSGLGEGPDSEWLCSFLNSLSSLIVHSFTHPFIHSIQGHSFKRLGPPGASTEIATRSHRCCNRGQDGIPGDLVGTARSPGRGWGQGSRTCQQPGTPGMCCFGV